MRIKVFAQRRIRSRGWLPLMALGMLVGLTPLAVAEQPASAAVAQSVLPANSLFAAPPGEGVVPADERSAAGPAAGPAIVPVGCASCDAGLLGSPPPPMFAGPTVMPVPTIGCPSGNCYAGRKGCDCCCDSESKWGHLWCGIYKCICCPDPCYEPCFVPLANAALGVDPVQPVTQVRIRADFGWAMTSPDKAEWFWAQEKGRGPSLSSGGPAVPAAPGLPGSGAMAFPGPGEGSLDYRLASLYMEGAVGRFGVFVEMTYVDTDPTTFPGAAGFGDMNVGMKTLLLDCDLIKLTSQFRVFIPTGNVSEGLGNGHATLEPSLIWALKLTPETYFQGQVAYWRPIGGTDSFAGPVFHYHLSLNQLLCNCGKDVQLIGTAELNGYEITSGAYTQVDGTLGSARDLNPIISVGPGLRLSVCNVIDFGVGAAFSLTSDRLANQLIRAEFRWRF